MKNKKIIIIGIVMLFVVGITAGIINSRKPKEIEVSPQALENLIESEYKVANLDTKTGKVVISGSIEKEDAIKLAKNIYQKLGTPAEVEINFFNPDAKTVENLSEFYAEGLTNKIVVNKEKNNLLFYEYQSVESVEPDGNATESWAINNVGKGSSNLTIDVALNNDTSVKEVVAQVKALEQMIKELNPDVDAKTSEFRVNLNEEKGFAYDTGFESIIASTENIPLK